MAKFMSACLQQRHEAATAVQSHQIIAAAHMGLANKDLRHGTPTGQGHHAVTLIRGEVDSHLLDMLDAASFEDLLGPVAIGTNSGGVHLDGWHGLTVG